MTRPELVIGRRHQCDIRLDFDNISGKHCTLQYSGGVWHVRDMASTNGTFVNGQKIAQDHTVMPDDELSLATHGFAIDYDPAVAPGALINPNVVLDEEAGQGPRSLMELAGLEDPKPSRRTRPPASERPPVPGREPSRERVPPSSHRVPAGPRPPEPPRAREPEPAIPVEDDEPRFQDSVPAEFQAPGPKAASDDDFFDLIKEDVEKAKGQTDTP